MVEFLQNLIFGVDYPGLALALDPITIALMTQGLTKGVQGLVQNKRGKGLKTEGRDLFDQQVEDFRSGKYDLGLGQGVYDAYTNTQRLAEEAANRTGEAGRSAISSAIANTRYGDPRTAFLTPKTAGTVMGAISDANVKAAEQQAKATMGLATTEQGIKTANETMRQQMESMMMARGAGQEQQGLQQMSEGANTAIGGFGGAAGAYSSEKWGEASDLFGENDDTKTTETGTFDGTEAFGAGMAGGTGGMVGSDYGQVMNQLLFGGLPGYDNLGNKKTSESGGRVPKYILGGMLDQIGGTMGDSLMKGIGKRRAAKGKDTKIFGHEAGDFDQEGNLMEDDSGDVTITVSKDGKTQTMGHGGVAPEILPGEFDHEENPIHMIDDNGNKVAEATGGEILFNKNQSNNLIKLLQSGEPEALYAYLAELMQSPQFQMEVEEYNLDTNDEEVA